MKKNVFLLILDSFIYDKIGAQNYGPTTSPFLDHLKSKTINTTNLYSYGPFTEAGATPLLSGNDLLNEGGYMHNLNTKKNHFIDVFKENDYEIFDVFHPYFMYSDETLKKIDNQFFSSDFIFKSVFINRLSYFSSIKERRKLSEEEYADLIKQLEITFTAWRNFLNYSKKTEAKYSLIKKSISNFDFEKNKSVLNKEFDKFIFNRIAYIDSVLELKMDHPLFKIENINPSELINQPIVNKYFYNKNKMFLLQVFLLQFWWNLKNNNISFKRLLFSFIESIRNKKTSGYFKSVLFTLFVGAFSFKYRRRNFLKEMPSLNAHINFILESLKNRDFERSFMVKIHAEDLHNRTSYFSYDAKEKGIVIEEINTIKTYFKKILNNFTGSLIYDFSVAYVDLCIERLFKGLNEMNLLNNTIVVITSDHGCSYVNSPIREKFVNNYHTENYKIPLFIYSPNATPKTYNDFYTSKDILPTVYELCGITIPTNISGHSILDKKNTKKYALSEYMGGGCPDIRLRPINYIIRDEKFLIAYKVKLKEQFEYGEIIEIYNLITDKYEEKNLINDQKFDLGTIKYLLKNIKKRHLELQNHYKQRLSNKSLI